MTLVRPKKYLGQHFLTDLQIARSIALSLEDYSGLPVLEIGPGMGVLTQFLLEKYKEVSVVEIDRESVEYLSIHYPLLEGKIIGEDFLKMNLTHLFEGRDFSVIGNYPYNISSQIFFKIIENRNRIPCCSGMIQKEVAERIAAPPGSKTYGILSILLQAWYDIEYLFTVHEHVFNPPPKVKSAVIRLVRNQNRDLGCDEELFKRVVKTAFNQRRKTMRNSLKPLGIKDISLFGDPVFDLRPEQLSVKDFVNLTQKITPYLLV